MQGTIENLEEEINLTGKQKKFADFYVGECNLNATRAAEAAGYRGSYGTLANIGNQNLKKLQIRRYIDSQLDKTSASASEVISILTKHAKGSLADVLNEDGEFDLQEAKRRGFDGLLKKVKVKKFWDKNAEAYETTYEYEIHDPQSAAVQLGKIRGLFTDKVEVSGNLMQPVADALGQFEKMLIKVYDGGDDQDEPEEA